ncbi:hypothetical protein G4O51_11905 [Candidatus Bathyarchaeota archaeon A05DMB-2]|nr:hypothetical protein [Candidatus Bathyarchaeota archaeon A05DMB-2]
MGKRWRFYDETDAPVDPDLITITVKAPNGNVIATLSKTDLIREATGVYKMLWNVPEDASAGFWLILVKATRAAGNIVNTETFSFQVTA